MITVSGRLRKSGDCYLAFLPILDAVTQGETQEDAGLMLNDLLVQMCGKGAIDVYWAEGTNQIRCVIKDMEKVTPAMLQRNRQKLGWSIRETAQKLGYPNHNAYAAYEYGKRSPSMSKLADILEVFHQENILIIGYMKDLSKFSKVA